jgi:hypothetical protein
MPGPVSLRERLEAEMKRKMSEKRLSLDGSSRKQKPEHEYDLSLATSTENKQKDTCKPFNYVAELQIAKEKTANQRTDKFPTNFSKIQ